MNRCTMQAGATKSQRRSDDYQRLHGVKGLDWNKDGYTRAKMACLAPISRFSLLRNGKYLHYGTICVVVECLPYKPKIVLPMKRHVNAPSFSLSLPTPINPPPSNPPLINPILLFPPQPLLPIPNHKLSAFPHRASRLIQIPPLLVFIPRVL
jgi:hypothetical protein